MNEFKIENIKTGVISVHSVSDFFIDDIFQNGIDLDLEGYIDENGDSQDVLDLYEMDNPEVILGFIKDDKGKYIVDPNAELSVIYNGGQQTIQVVKSKFMKLNCALCSPCYPSQGDLDSDHGNIVCFTLNPEDLSENASSVTRCGSFAITELETK